MHVCYTCVSPLDMFESVSTDLQHICSSGTEPGIYVTLASDPQLGPFCSFPTNWLVSTIAPDHQACMLQLHLTSSHVFISCILSAYMSVIVSSWHPCILHLHLTISNVCNNCIQPFAMYFTVAPNQQSISNHVCCLLHIHQTSIEVMVVTIAPGQQTCILQLHPASSQDSNEQLQHADILLMDCILCRYTAHHK